MEKKYYDIIVSLVKQNDKYYGCEPILDDIVQDVYEHSKVVLGSVTNEDVIAAYLNKVVATSLITVPKKLNFNTKNKHRVISNVEAITKISLQPKPVEPEPVNEIVEEIVPEETQNFDFQVDEPIVEESVQEDELTLTLDEEPIVEQEDLSFETNLEISEEEEEELQEDSFIQEEEPTFEEIIEEPIATEEFEPIEDFTETIEPEVDKTLVDNMINGVSIEENEEEEPESFELLEEPVADTVIEEEILVEDEEMPLLEEEPLGFDLADEPVMIEETEEVSIDNDMVEESYTLPNFECFSYEPDTPEYDAEEICAELKELDTKHPEKKLLQVCKLKYEENLSVSEIAKSLDFSEETVLDILNDIIELVKD